MTKIGQNYPFVLIVYEATSSSPSVVRSQVSLIVVTILTTVMRAQYQEYIIFQIFRLNTHYNIWGYMLLR